MGYLRLAVAVSLLSAGCGGGLRAEPPTPALAQPGESSEQSTADAGPAPLPVARPRDTKELLATCAVNDNGLCLPDAALVSRLCDGSFPDVALVLLQGKSPFSRAYVRGEREGWNADVGKSARAKLWDREEVLVLKRRLAPKNGIVVGAGGGFLVMRWDGNCYTLEDAEVATTKPSGPKHAAVPWHLLESGTKDSLLKSARVLSAFQKRGRECKGVTRGEVSKACEAADGALTAAVVDELRSGMVLPTPSKLP